MAQKLNMTPNTNTTTLLQSQSQLNDTSNNSSIGMNNQSVMKKKLDKIRSKLSELFFPSPAPRLINTQSQQEQQQQHKQVNDNASSDSVSLKSEISSTGSIHGGGVRTSRKNSTIITEPLNNSMLISSYYYGYKSFIEDNVTNSNSSASSLSTVYSSSTSVKKSNPKKISNLRTDRVSSDSCSTTSSTSTSTRGSTSSSIFIDDNNNTPVITSDRTSHHNFYMPSSSSSAVADSLSINNYDNVFSNNSSSSSSCSETSFVINPFLDKKYTDLLNFSSDINILNTHFDHALHLIDEENNFFDANFMTNYISYILLVKLNQSDLYKSINLKDCTIDNKSDSEQSSQSNGECLLKHISREIFLQSENEPCGLKGCKMNIFLQTNDNNESQLLTQFRFDTTCSLTTFELTLVVKQKQNDSNLNQDDESCYSATQDSSNTSLNSNMSLATLTRRLLGRSRSKTPSSSSTTTTTGALVNSTQEQIIKKSIYLDKIDFGLFKCKLY